MNKYEYINGRMMIIAALAPYIMSNMKNTEIMKSFLLNFQNSKILHW